ncbi:hypothetical protein C8J57DRAFT_1659887 [Mycena rebaudengoi]|nr:hypothetical protein C8J57DRAFT_1659887 [Mycena rebaudengoi]
MYHPHVNNTSWLHYVAPLVHRRARRRPQRRLAPRILTHLPLTYPPPTSSAYAAPAQHHHHAQQRPIPSSGATTNATSNSTFHTTPSGPAYRAAPACERLDGAVRPGHLLADAAIRDAAIHHAERDAAHADGKDFYFYTLASSPVSSACTSSSSTTSESCSASEESTSESESEGEEEGYDAPAYTPPTSRRDIHPPLTSHSPARTDRWRDAEMMYVPGSSKARDHRAAPQHVDHHAAGSSDTRAWAAEQARRMRRLRVVPADPSAYAYRPQQQAQQLQPQYGCVGGGGGGAAAADGVSGWRAAAAVDAPNAVRDAPGTATPATAACPGAPTPATAPIAYAATHATPAPAARRPHARTTTQWTSPRVRGGQWSLGVGEVVPSQSSQAPQVPSHGLAPPAHTHTLPQLAPLAQAPMPRRANAGPPGVKGYAYAY